MVSEIENVKKMRIYVFLSGVVFIILTIDIIALLDNEKIGAWIWIPWILGICLCLISVYLMGFKFQYCTDSNVTFGISGSWVPILRGTYTLYYDEIKEVNVQYTRYSVNFSFLMKYGTIKISIWPKLEVYKWLFPLLNVLHTKCDSIIHRPIRLLNTKQWISPDQLTKTLEIQRLYSKQNKVITFSVILLIILWNIFAFFFYFVYIR